MKLYKFFILLFSLFLHPINGGIGGGDPFGKQSQSSQQPAAETNQNPQWETIHGFPSLPGKNIVLKIFYNLKIIQSTTMPYIYKDHNNRQKQIHSHRQLTSAHLHPFLWVK